MIRARGTVVVCAAVACGCARYQPRPLDPPALERAYRARTLPDLSRPLDLAALYAAARETHPDVAIAKARLAIAEAAVMTAAGRPNPVFSGGSGWTNSPESPAVLAFDFGLTLETAGKRAKRVLQARRLAEAARLDVSEAEWNVRSRLRSALATHAFAIRELESARGEAAIRAEIARMLEKRVAAGEAARPLADTARVESAGAQAALKAAEGTVAETLASLAAAAGLPAPALAGARFTRIGALPPKVALERVLRAGLLHRIDIRRGLLEYAAAEAGLQLEVARQYPDIQLTPGYNFDEGHHHFTFTPSLPLPVFNRNRGPIAEAEARRREVEARFTALQAQAISALEIAQSKSAFARAEFADAGSREAAAREREARVRRAFEAGEEDRLALAGARLETVIVNRQRFDALKKAWAAFGALEDAVQQPLMP